MYELCERGELRHARVLNAVRVARSDLQAFIERRSISAPLRPPRERKTKRERQAHALRIQLGSWLEPLERFVREQLGAKAVIRQVEKQSDAEFDVIVRRARNEWLLHVRWDGEKWGFKAAKG